MTTAANAASLEDDPYSVLDAALDDILDDLSDESESENDDNNDDDDFETFLRPGHGPSDASTTEEVSDAGRTAAAAPCLDLESSADSDRGMAAVHVDASGDRAGATGDSGSDDPPLRGTAPVRRNRPKFGPPPPPPPPPEAGAFGGFGGFGGFGEAKEEDVEAYFREIQKELGAVGGGAADGGSDGELADLFRTMARMDNNNDNDNDNEGGDVEEADEKKSSSVSSGVDDSISRLLDGMADASAAEAASSSPPPSSSSDQSEVIPDLERFAGKMMGDVMDTFEKEFKGMSGADDSDDAVNGVMKQLLNKDLMYEPMKQVTDKFPKWLADRKNDLSEDEYRRYGTQYQYFQRIVRLYETDPDNFPRLMELMQDVQEYGQPPAEIIKELAPDLEFDDEGMPVVSDANGGMMPGMGGMMPGMMPPGMTFPGSGDEQCTLM